MPAERRALIVILAGVVAALHVGKLPPAIGALQQALGLGLVQAGFVLSLVQAAGMLLGLALGAVADALGGIRSMRLGLLVLAGASAAGGAAQGVAMLMAMRALEGLGFLLVVLPAPGLVRQLVAPERLPLMLGVWGAYMPLATTLALLAGPLCIAVLGWRAWWWLLAGLSLAMALWLWRALPGVQAVDRPAAAPQAAFGGNRLRRTLGSAGPWLVAISFGLYSGQWLAVVGFLPIIYAQAGVAPTVAGALTALAAAVNMLGNLGAGRLQHRGVAPTRVLVAGFVAMGLASAMAFVALPGIALPPWARYVAVLLFSGLGGLIPGTLFALAVRVAPGPDSLSTTVGWMQQWSALGQFAGPPLVAWLALRAGGWQWTWAATGACSLLGLGVAALLARRLARPGAT